MVERGIALESLLRVVAELLVIVVLALAFAPVLLAPRADKDECHAVLGRLGETHGLVVPAVIALHVLSALQSGILDAFGVDLEVLGSQGEVRPVNTIIDFASFHCRSVIVAQFAGELEETAITFKRTILFCVEHVIALGAEAHALELLCLSAPSTCTVLRHALAASLRRNHVCCLHRSRLLKIYLYYVYN